MADVSNLLQAFPRHHQEQELEFSEEDEEQYSYIQSLNPSIPNWPFYGNNNNPRLSPSSLSHIYPDSDSDSLTDMNYVTNLFESNQDRVFDDGLYQESIRSRVSGSNPTEEEEEEELGLGFGTEMVDNSSVNGLRVVGLDSDSDVEEEETDGINNVYGDFDLPVLWNCLRFDDQEDRNEGFDWEEVNEDPQEGLSSLIDRVEEISVSSEISSEEEDDPVNIGDEEAVQNFEWEVLLAVNNFNREFDIENDDGVLYLAVQDDYTYAAEYNTLFEQFVEIESALKGSPPAAKSVVDNLASIVLTKEYVQESSVVCAVCKDEIVVEERATQLPCSHHYHADCIVPWLKIRNSCPVCRFELPTDDADYEQRKGRTGGLGLFDDLQVRDNPEVLP